MARCGVGYARLSVRSWIPLLLCSSIALAVWPANTSWAQAEEEEAPDEAAQARALFEQGVEASQDHLWADAVDFFRRSRALMERPSAVFNTAVALHRMGRDVEALADIERYLQMTSASERGERQRYAQAETLRTDLTRRVAVLTLHLEPSNARVEVDGRAREGEGEQRDIDLDPGRHAIRVSADGHASAQIDVRLGAGERVEREVTLEVSDVEEPEPVPEPEPEPEPLVVPEEGGIGELGLVGIIIGGVGVAAGVGALVTGLMSQSTYDSLLERCTNMVCPPGSEDDISSGETLALVSTVMLGVSIVGIGVGVALLLVDLTSGDDDAQAFRVVPIENGAALRVQF